jgi:TolA-binding protein
MEPKVKSASFMRFLLIPSIACAAGTLTSCGADSNINQIWGKDSAADSLLAEAKSAYDQGRFDEAESIASKIVSKSPNNEEASILLGYIYLSQGGLDPYRVASCLIELSDTSGTASKTSASRCKAASSSTPAKFSKVEDEIDLLFSRFTEVQQNIVQSSTESESSGDVSETLKKLQGGLLNLTEVDFKNLQEKEFQGSSTLFKDSNKLLVPKKVSEDLRNLVFVLSKMNKVVKTICRFVNDDPEIRADSARYKAFDCAVTTEPRRSAAKAHYLWAIAHLAESLVYQSVLLYDTSESAASNIQAGSEALNGFSGDVLKYVGAITDLKDALDQVFDTSDASSMISACLNDLSSVNGAFSAITGLPPGVKQQLSKIMSKINEIAKSIGGSATQSNQTKALKTQMTEKITEKVGTQTNQTMAKIIEAKTGKAVDPNTITSASFDKLDETEKTQIKTLCTTFDSLSKDMPDDKKKASKPKGCS